MRRRRASSTESQRTNRASTPKPTARPIAEAQGLRRRAGARARPQPRPCERGDVAPEQHADDHQQQIEADQDVDDPVGRPSCTSRAGGHGAGRRDRDGDSRSSRAASRSGASSGLIPRACSTATLHHLVRRPPLAECWPRPSVMGVVNVTPDSFSDGGDNVDPAVAVARPGGCSPRARLWSTSAASRPARAPPPSPLEEELRRVCRCSSSSPALPVSIDTSKAEVARQALEPGALLVNDVTALRGDPHSQA